MPEFRCGPVAELAATLRGRETALRDAAMRRAETLHDQIESDATYPFAFLAFRLTGLRRDYGVDALYVGQAVRADLRLLIDQLSRTLVLPPSDGDALSTVQLAAELNVSTKTLSRWRADGLRWRWIVPQTPEATGDGASAGPVRRVIGFTAQAVAVYTAKRGDKVTRATGFSQMTDAQRDRLISRARRLAHTTDATLNQVAAHLAKRSGRALETLRLILEKHDRDHPDDPLFADRTGPLTTRQKRLISRAHRVGIGVGKLAERFRRSRGTIYRVLLERRVARCQRLPLSCVPHPHFDRDDAAAVYLRPGLIPARATLSKGPHSTVPLDGLPLELAGLYVRPVVSADKIRSLFLRYNYLKHTAAQIRQGWARNAAPSGEVDRFERSVTQAAQVRSLLVTWHLPAVLSVARRHVTALERPASRLIELLELANPVLIDAVESYDAVRQPTFESVLTNRMLKAFAARDAADAGPAKARKREAAGQVVQRMIDLANESGVYLALSEESADDVDTPGS